MKRLFVLLSTVFLLFGAQEAMAQARTVTGRVTEAATGQPLPGITVTVKGSTLGTQTNAEGRYSINVPANANTLVFSSIAYGLVEQPITGATVDVQMSPKAVALQGVVVTALGQEREKSTLGTAQQTVSTEDLNVTRAQNVMSQLEGKVSGVSITSAGTPGGSVNINIRGVSSITGNNQPLFVVDGTPVSDDGRGGNIIAGYDFGNAISDLNPQDIASITVLKGPNAAALYGSRAANGVILITTKKGRAGEIQTSASVTYDWERPSILPDFQNEYGQGSGGSFEYVNGAGAGDCDGCDQSYGPKLDGRLICQFNSPMDASGNCQPTPWIAHPDNVHDYFDTGHTLTTHLSVSGGTDRANGRLSLGVDNTDGYVPNNSFQKVSALLNAQLKLSDKLTTTGNIEYVHNRGIDRPGTGYYGSPLETFFWFGRQVDINDLRDFAQGGAVNNGPADREYNWNYNYHNNPFWIQYENPVSDSRDRITLSGTAQYQITDWLIARLHSGSDIYRLNIDENWAHGNLTYTNLAYNGGFQFLNDYNNENNTNFTLTANHDLTSKIDVNAMVGGAARRTEYTFNGQSTSGLSVAGIYNVSNAAIAPSLGQSVSRQAVNSVYGSLAFTWDGWWTVEGTGRNDWSSTLPEGANSYFYPSVNTSIVLTDAMPSLRNNVLSYAKIRGSVARVGNDASPYQLLTTYSGNSNKFAGLPQFSLGNTLANAALKPELTTSYEAGAELGFFQNRASLDVTYYNKTTRNQIFNIPISPASGFSSKAINAGAVNNKGWEALFSVTPVQTGNFQWTSTVNWSKNNSMITELYPGISQVLLGDAGGYASIFGDIQLRAQVNRPYGAFYGKRFARDAATGKLLTNDKGWPVAEDTLSYLGTYQPDWTGGWNNEFTLGAFSLNVLFDARHGGKIFSYTNEVGETSGVLASTLRGREADWNKPGIVVDGINENTGEPNTKNVTSEAYFQSLFEIAEPYIYDASYVKLRELRLGFDVPARWTNNLRISSLNVALTGRNLITWKNVPNIDPEFTYGANHYQGIEYAMVSNPRSIGLSFQVRP